MSAKPLPLGYSQNQLMTFPAEARRLHLHLIGPTGAGKSKFIEHCIREDIVRRRGVCLIDPDGGVFHKIVRWLARKKWHINYPHRKVHILDPSLSDWVFRFNPLHLHAGESAELRVNNFMTAMARVWGQDFSNFPTIDNTCAAICEALLYNNLSPAEGLLMTDTTTTDGVVQFLMRYHPDETICDQLQKYLRDLGVRETMMVVFNEFQAVRRRFLKVFRNEYLRLMMSATADSIDFRQCMENGDIVLVNLAQKEGGLSEESARSIGALLLREMLHCAYQREEDVSEGRPFYCYVDECADFLTDDIDKMLARTRKRGFHVVLAHQWLGQLTDQSEKIYKAVMGIQNRIVFGGLELSDTMVLADSMLGPEYDLEMPVAALRRNTIVGQRLVWLYSWSEAESETLNWSTTKNQARTVMQSHGRSSGVNVGGSTTVVDGNNNPIVTTTAADLSGEVNSEGQAATEGLAESQGGGLTKQRSFGATQAYENEWQEVTTAVHSLENVRHMAAARLATIPERNAVARLKGLPVFDFGCYYTPDVVVPKKWVKEFLEAVLSSSPYTQPRRQVVAHYQERRQALLEDATRYRLHGPQLQETLELSATGEVVEDKDDPFVR